MPLNLFNKNKNESHHKTSEENKFLKWTESDRAIELVDMKIDENGYILHWRDRYKKSEYLDIALIRDVRTGKYANIPKDKNHQKVFESGQTDVPIEDKTLSIYYGSDFSAIKCINFVSMAHSGKKVAKELTDMLFKLATSPKTKNLSPWEQINKLRSILLYGKANFDEKSKEFQLPIQTLVDFFLSNDKQKQDSEKLRIYVNLKSMGLPNEKDGIINEKQLTAEVFSQLVLRLAITDSFQDVLLEYGSIFGDRQWSMNAEQLEYFINEVQRDTRLNEILFPYLTIEQVINIIKKYEFDTSYRKKNLFSKLGFVRYLMDVQNEIVDFKNYELYDDMKQPLSHYFINSSHNTYLTGHQLTGKSDVEIYRQVLLSGCRCIELDCWDDEVIDEPIITHGRTLVTKILFKDVIEAINESAFKTSPYPVMLSLENHCCEKLQKKMAKYMVEIFGENLLIDPLPLHPLSPGITLPSPDDLKYKILIKNRKNTQINNESLKSKKSEVFHNENKNNYKNETEFNKKYENLKLSLTIQSSVNDDNSDTENDSHSYSTEMSNLVNYLQPVKFRSFDQCESLNRAYELSSFVETKAYNLIKEYAIKFVNYNKRSLSRIYPKGTRISSDNYMPQVYWNAGCQLVALNFQTLDVPMQLNMAKFSYNNNCGYLLKPEQMRRIGVNQSYDPFSIKPLPQIQPQTATIQILNGIFISDKQRAHTIVVEIFGLPADTYKGERAFKTKITSCNLFNTVFNDYVITFPRIIMPSLALIRFCAYDEQNKFIGHRVIPLNDIRSGYRYICLKNESYQPLNVAMIFVNINVRNYVPEDYKDLENALCNPIEHITSLEKNKGIKNEEQDERINVLETYNLLTESEKNEKMLQLLTEEEDEITHL